MNKFKISIGINVIFIIICIALVILLFKTYESNNKAESVPENIQIKIGAETMTRIGILSSNGKHYEITHNTDMNILRAELNNLKLQLDKNNNGDKLPGSKFYITFYSLWDRMMFECGIVDENTIRYNGNNYTIIDSKIDIQKIIRILDNLK